MSASELAPTRTRVAGVACPSPGPRSRCSWGVHGPAPWSDRHVLSCVGGTAVSSGGGQGGRQRRGPVASGQHRWAARDRAVRPGTVALRARPRCLSPGQPPSPTTSRAWRQPGGQGVHTPGWWRWVAGRPGPPRPYSAPQPRRAGDRFQPPLVPRCGFQRRLTPSVRWFQST